MIKVVTGAEMREMDRLTIEELGIPGVVLMENAGLGTFHTIQELLEEIEDPLVYVFCGKGNNGGDGFVVARYLWDSGINTEIFCIAKEGEIRGDARINYDVVRKMGIPLHFIQSNQDLVENVEEIPDLIVDALLGTGTKGAVKGLIKDVIEFINGLETFVVAVDIPSGLNADSPEIAGAIIRADVTVTMALPKRCHVLYPARESVGELYIADIGIPRSFLNSDDVRVQVVEESDIALPDRPADVHKYGCGKVAVLAGSAGYTGAATLTAEAALKIGAGLVMAGIPQSLNPIMEQKLTEVITRPLPETGEQTIGKNSLKQIESLLEWCDVLAIGPGLGRGEEVQDVILQILRNFKKLAVVDADALFALANKPQVLKLVSRSSWILTPHLGEFARFLPHVSRAELSLKRIEFAQQFARENQLTLLLKGAPSLVVAEDGKVFINSTGNPGLASGGTGDVLTGFVAGLVAQGFKPVRAAYTANFLHGYIADSIAKEETSLSLTAGDLIRRLGSVLKDFET